MRLSLCLIARNEEQNLPRAISSFAGLCDEIIVADTGSTDNTVSVARELGATVVSFPWRDDFSAARNFCIQHAHGEWIFWLDADEALLPESRLLVDACLARPDAAGWFVLRQDLHRADRLDLFTEMWQLRLFRRDPEMSFIGRCHPSFQPAGLEAVRRRGQAVLPSAIRLRHWGFINELKPAKLRRAMRLLELELADRPGQLYYEIEYARTLLALGEHDKGNRMLAAATTHLLQHRDDPRPPTPVAEALLEWLLASPPGALDAAISYDDIWDLSRRWFPKSAPLIWAQSRRQFDAGQLEAAAHLLEELLQLGRSGSYDRFTSFNPRVLREDAALNLSVCYIRLARLDEAETILKTLLPTPRRAEAEQNLEAVRRLRGMQELM